MSRRETLAAKAPVTLYHDGHCPLCQREVAWLARHPLAARVELVDIQAPDFDPAPLGKRFAEMMGSSVGGLGMIRAPEPRALILSLTH
ncbi:DCC1-like thiol-disulfide oxidoreductase family protein [Halomonas alkalisoli]|uniref:DCC1-like thiol-disulfide oxidoreductase family protein n=1 Tax=Halomonas alkalisoli TaxID=2907158 RepID=UPI001F324B8F|nr:DCC1-like thiol-disulfide oxidoreductase family protein [Halomonas alkalisoli]MCE9680747.1 DUF393 domain-containing protein [Halomonas alkalisoli]